MLVIKAGLRTKPVRISNREDPDQTASVLEILEQLPYFADYTNESNLN